MQLTNKSLLFIGDSITDMSRGRNLTDQNHIYGHSFVFLLASLLRCEHPLANITLHNRGESGDGSPDIAARWERDAVALSPDIINLLVGINDVIHFVDKNEGCSAKEYYDTVARLIEQTRKARPETAFILCEPFASPEAAAARYRLPFATMVPLHQEAARALARDYGCLFVPLQEEFDRAILAYPTLGPSYWLWDGIHPTAQGQRLIAKKWLSVISPEINSAL